jgi:DNA polymerase V
VFALFDGNNFYHACEAVFRPFLRGRAHIVMSNNDGATIARSKAAKALGIRMGQPVHELRDYERRHGLLMSSANFELYGDISRRVLAVLRDQVPRVEPYSIDESFCDCTGIRDIERFAHDLRDRIHRFTGIENCCGLSTTKVLSKAANRIAKKGAGVVLLRTRAEQDVALRDFPVADVWGVGPRSSTKLAALGISTAAELRDAPSDMILDRFGVVMLRTQRELQGFSCLSLQEIEPDRQQIVVSRSFGERVEDHAAVAQALATFAVRACEKLRRRGLVAAGISIFASTDTFRPELRQHHPSRAMTLASPTGDSRAVLAAVRALLANFLRRGCAYKRAGIALLDLARPESLQTDLFAAAPSGKVDLMSTLDRINHRFGRGTAGFGASGWQERPAWGMRQRNVSPCFTTRWSDVPLARC